jgi:hypothetical protein
MIPWPVAPDDPSLLELLPLPHGRSTGGCVLAWPGGPSTESGHIGRACFGLWRTGLGVGRVVGVGSEVGVVVGVEVGVDVGVPVGVGPGIRVGRGVRLGFGSELG